MTLFNFNQLKILIFVFVITSSDRSVLQDVNLSSVLNHHLQALDKQLHLAKISYSVTK